MANITAKDVNELRKMTGVGMMDCKKALTETDGNVEEAIKILREKGLATQAKKAGRVAAEGIVMATVNADSTVGAIVEVNIETDFAANSDKFKGFVKAVADTVIAENPADLEALNACTISGGDKTVAEELQEVFLSIRENMQIRRFARLEGTVVPYVHQGGRAGALVSADCSVGCVPAVQEALKDCAMQVVALHPAYLVPSDVPQSALDQEKEIILSQMNEDEKMASKPAQVKEKIAEGKIGKYYSENCLMEQTFVKDSTKTVKGYIADVAKAAGAELTVTGYLCYELGEGIEKKTDDLAAEVASMIG